MVLTLSPANARAADQSVTLMDSLRAAHIEVVKVRRQSRSGQSYVVWLLNDTAIEQVVTHLQAHGQVRVMEVEASTTRAAADLAYKRKREEQQETANEALQSAAAATQAALALVGQGGTAKAKRRNGSPAGKYLSCSAWPGRLLTPRPQSLKCNIANFASA